jgi:hypothetical protein
MLFSQIKGIHKKIIIGCSICAVILVSGFGVYVINTVGKEDISSEQKVEDNITNENTSDENVKEKEKQPVDQPKVDENKPNDTTNTNAQNNADSRRNKSTQSQQVEQTKSKRNEKNTKKQNVQEKQVSNKPITYTSKGLGLSFDMPTSWVNKYVIKDNGTEISFYMNHDSSLGEGDGLLFIITSDINDYDKGGLLDTIADIKKIKEIKGKKYLVGGPKDCRIEKGNPDKDTYITLVQQVPQVLKSLR